MTRLDKELMLAPFSDRDESLHVHISPEAKEFLRALSDGVGMPMGMYLDKLLFALENGEYLSGDEG